MKKNCTTVTVTVYVFVDQDPEGVRVVGGLTKCHTQNDVLQRSLTPEMDIWHSTSGGYANDELANGVAKMG